MTRIGDLLIDKYRIVGKLGKGGMGDVYEALHEQLGKRTAVKFLRKELSNNQHAMTRFQREARAASATGHPSIVDIYDISIVTMNYGESW